MEQRGASSIDLGCTKFCMNPEVEKQMSRKTMFVNLREKMVAISLKPSDACIMKGNKDHRDNRRWDGRTSEACYRKWMVCKSIAQLFYHYRSE